ncbi:hypothetical protein NECAME_02322 [Necator americanus]|uniref:Uncharacterized protein n=1 Tax=Necator americanus TaxID=51031 RepID=W2THS9_NECAM|nr:hypothetical protein NECAME_02322 [Necator americanus]ETN80577.1 hypothetical protein NECAME_02322 [Necator americanus]
MGNWLEARMSPGTTFALQVIMVGIIVLDFVLGVVGAVIYAVHSKKISKKLRLRDAGGEEPLPLVGPEQEEDPAFGFVGMPRNQRKQYAKSDNRFLVIPPAVPKQNKKRTNMMREGAVQ